MTKKEVVLFNVGNEQLSGVFHYPETIHSSSTQPIIIVHGFVGSKVGVHRLFVHTANKLANEGFPVFRFDFSGCGESSGDYYGVTVSKQLNELSSAIDLVKETFSTDQVTILGHSLGGAISTIEASQRKDVSSLILWAPVARPYEDIVRITGKSLEETAYREHEVHFEGFRLSADFFIDLKKHHPLDKVSSFQGNVSIFHGQSDLDVSSNNLSDYFQAYCKKNHPSKMNVKLIAEADHTFSQSDWKQQVIHYTIEHLKTSSKLIHR